MLDDLSIDKRLHVQFASWFIIYLRYEYNILYKNFGGLHLGCIGLNCCEVMRNFFLPANCSTRFNAKLLSGTQFYWPSVKTVEFDHPSMEPSILGIVLNETPLSDGNRHGKMMTTIKFEETNSCKLLHQYVMTPNMQTVRPMQVQANRRHKGDLVKTRQVGFFSTSMKHKTLCWWTPEIIKKQRQEIM